MEKGLNSVQKASEEVNRRNAQMTVQHSNDTRAIVREQAKTIIDLKNMVAQQNLRIDGLEARITTLLQHAFAGGPTA